MSRPTSSVVKRPSYAGSAVAVLAAFAVAGLLANHALQLAVVGLEAIGGLALLGSALARQRGRPVSGATLLFAGSGTVVLSLGLGVVFPLGPYERGAFAGATLGAALVLLGLYPLRAAWSRTLVGAGVALLAGSVVLLEWVAHVGRVQLPLAVASIVVTWDAAEHAITLGSDVGRGARSLSVTLAHALGSLCVGSLAVVVAAGASAFTLPGIPVAALALLLGAALLLLTALYVGDLA